LCADRRCLCYEMGSADGMTFRCVLFHTHKYLSKSPKSLSFWANAAHRRVFHASSSHCRNVAAALRWIPACYWLALAARWGRSVRRRLVYPACQSCGIQRSPVGGARGYLARSAAGSESKQGHTVNSLRLKTHHLRRIPDFGHPDTETTYRHISANNASL
jgi:hypothetical protein